MTMIKTKLLQHIFRNGQKTFISTNIKYNKPTTDFGIDAKKLEHYRNLNALNDTGTNPVGWDKAKPFEAIPGPKPLPIIGNSWRFFVPKIGDFAGKDPHEAFKQLKEQYGNISVLKGLISRRPMVILFDVNDFETLYRNEGVWPIRDASASMVTYRKQRPDLFKLPGIITTHGEEWFKFRSVVNPILMQPRNMLQYVDRMNVVADQLTDNMRYFSEQNPKGEMPENFNYELYKWALESVGVVTMDKHLGCLNRDADTNSEPQQVIRNAVQMFELMYKLDVLPSFLWKIMSTSNWRKFVQVSDFLAQTNLKYVNQYLDKLERGEIDSDSNSTNVLQKLIKIDRNVATTMAVDMLVAGIDTTGRTLGAALYFLARYPEIQEQFRKEAFSLLETKDTPITKEVLAKAPYLKGVVKETLRLAPIATGNVRTTVRNLVLGGYQIPKGTDVVTSNLALCQMDEHFPRAKEFLPQRWLPTTTGELSHKNSNAFLYLPFGFGPRSCIGKRLAYLELEVALLKIVRNFELSWPHEDMVFATKLLYGIASPLKIHVKPVDN